MRWDHLFDDLESQLERELTAEDQDLELEEERLRLGRLSLRDRLVALHRFGADRLTVCLSSGDRVIVRVESFGRDWFSAEIVDGGARPRRCIVPLSSVESLSLVPSSVTGSLQGDPDARAEASLSMRLGLPFVLRDLCRRRLALDLVLARTTLHGTIDRVGRDHVDLAVHEPGAPRRGSLVSEVRLVPLASIVLIAF